MSDRRSAPIEADFTKTLAVVLMAEYLGVIAARGMDLACAVAASAATDAVAWAATALFIAVLGMNLSSMAAAAAMRRDPAHAGLAKISFAMTGGQTLLLVPSFLSSNLAFHAAAFVLTAAMLTATLASSQGKLLRPPS